MYNGSNQPQNFENRSAAVHLEIQFRNYQKNAEKLIKKSKTNKIFAAVRFHTIARNTKNEIQKTISWQCNQW